MPPRRRRVQRPTEEEEEMDLFGGARAEEGTEITMEDIDRLKSITEKDFPMPAYYGAAYGTDGRDRLTILKMVFENFKSYYGKVTIGPFHDNFTAIVGANGSGKSNIIDGLLFVFGSKALKIRSDKLDKIIHKSKGAQHCKHCSVEVHFQSITNEQSENESIWAPVPASQFVVKRTVNTSGQSKYFFNENVVLREELIENLVAKGVDMEHNRFLILQGEVEQISLMKPKAATDKDKGYLEYLDDIIGTSRYKSAVQKLETNVLGLLRIKEEKLRLFNDAEKRRNNVLRPAQELTKMLCLENCITHVQHKLLLVDERKLTKQIAELTEKQAEKNTALDEKKAELKEVQAAILKVKNFRLEHETELKKLQSELNRNDRQLNDSQMNLDKVFKNLESAGASLTSKTDEIKCENLKISNLEKRPDKNSAAVEKLKTELETVEEELALLQPEVEAKNAEAQAKNAALEKKLRVVADKLVELRAQKESAEASVRAKQENLAHFEKDASDAEDKATREVENISRRKQELAANEAALAEKKAAFEAAKANAAETEEKKRDLDKRCSKASSSFNEKQARLHDISRNRKDGKEMSDVLQRIMNETHSGRIPGIYGRLGDLGTIDPKYDVAVSSFAGGSLDFIVVEDNATVKKCLQFVNEQGIARTSFIDLQAVQRSERDMAAPPAPFNLPRLIDLITPDDPKFRSAFYSRIRDTLVCEDINTASKASFYQGQRRDVVTTDGNMARSSGTVCGGGRIAFRGKMRLSSQQSAQKHGGGRYVSESEIQQLKAEVATAQSALRALELERSDCGRKLEDTVVLARNLDRDVKSLEGRIRAAKEDLPRMESAAREAQKRVVDKKNLANGPQVAAIRKEIAVAQKKIDDHAEELQGVEANHKALRDEMDSMTDAIAGSVNAKQKTLADRKTEIRTKMEKLRKASSTAVADISRSKNKIDGLEAGIAKSKKEIDVLEEKRAVLQESVAQLKAIVDEQTSRVDAIKAALDKDEESQEANNEGEVRLKKEIAALKEEIEGTARSLAKKTHRLDENAAEMRALKLHDFAAAVNDPLIVKARPGTSHNVEDAEMRSSDEESDWTDEDDDEDEDDEEGIRSPKKGFGDPLEEPPLEARKFQLEQFTEEEVAAFDSDLLKSEFEELTEKRKKITTPVNFAILEDYYTKTREYNVKMKDYKDILTAVENVRQIYDSIVSRREKEFNTALNKISNYLDEQYRSLSGGGGMARLETVVSDPYAEGIVFNVCPPQKGWRPIAQTSGGEKTLSSLSLVFALHQFLPTPFYVMDEIDAALDANNVNKISNFVTHKTKNSQFIIISLRNNMYQPADRLIGVYKVNDRASAVMLSPPTNHKANEKRRKAGTRPAAARIMPG